MYLQGPGRYQKPCWLRKFSPECSRQFSAADPLQSARVSTEARTASYDNLSQTALRGCSFPSASLPIVAMTLNSGHSGVSSSPLVSCSCRRDRDRISRCIQSGTLLAPAERRAQNPESPLSDGCPSLDHGVSSPRNCALTRLA